jgi:hypothetical protein
MLHRVKEQRNILRTVKLRVANWMGHILCGGTAFMKHVMKGNIEWLKR